MKKMLLSVLVLSMGACSTTPPEPTYKHELINNPSEKEMDQNDIEKLLAGTEWSEAVLAFIPVGNYKFTYDSVEGKRVIKTFTNVFTRTVTESRDSYKIEKDVWGSGNHRLYLDNKYLDLGNKPEELLELRTLPDNKMLWNFRYKDANAAPAMSDEVIPYTVLTKKK